MVQPIVQYLPLIQGVVNRIPSNRLITRLDISKLQIDDIKMVFNYTFPKSFSKNNYRELGYLVELTVQVMKEIPDNAVIIAAGDSPSKIVNLINLLWKNNDTTYFPQRSKTIQFIRFPLSKVKNIGLESLSNYLKQILESNGIDYQRQTRFIDLDYIESGASHQKIGAALQLLNYNIVLDQINLRDLWIDLADQTGIDLENVDVFDLIKDADIYDARCVPEYPDLNSSVPQLNLRQCNLIVALLYLKAIQKLGKTPLLPTIQGNFLMDETFYSVDYYDLSTNTVKTNDIFINATWNRAYGFIIEDNVVKFRTIGLTLESIVKFTHIPNERIYGDYPRNFPLSTPLIVQLVNDEKIMAEYNGTYFETTKWSNAVVDEDTNPDGWIRKEFVRTYELLN